MPKIIKDRKIDQILAGLTENAEGWQIREIEAALVNPDEFRPRYRKALIDCVGEAIRRVCEGRISRTGEVLSELAAGVVPEKACFSASCRFTGLQFLLQRTVPAG